jgi:hypothetical protein
VKSWNNSFAFKYVSFWLADPELVTDRRLRMCFLLTARSPAGGTIAGAARLDL